MNADDFLKKYGDRKVTIKLLQQLLTETDAVYIPALKEQKELAQPPVPQGPIPELKVPTFGKGNAQPAPSSAEPAPTPVGPTVQAPRD